MKSDNVDLLVYVMNFVESYYTNRGSGKIKEEVVRNVLDKCSELFLNQMIPFVIKNKLLKPKSYLGSFINFLEKKNLQKKLRRTL